MKGELVENARSGDLNISALAEAAIAAEHARRARARWDGEIAEACAAHERYLEEYGSAGDLLREQMEEEERRDAAG